jgi:phage terminase small subunit
MSRAQTEASLNDLKLSPKQVAFCEYYVACGNATEAAKKAGYSQKNVKQQGAENLSKPYLLDYIINHNEVIKAHSTRILDAIKRQELLSEIAISGNEETSDRIRAIDVLNKMTGEYIERVRAEVTHNEGVLPELLKQLKG